MYIGLNYKHNIFVVSSFLGSYNPTETEQQWYLLLIKEYIAVWGTS